MLMIMSKILKNTGKTNTTIVGVVFYKVDCLGYNMRHRGLLFRYLHEKKVTKTNLTLQKHARETGFEFIRS